MGLFKAIKDSMEAKKAREAAIKRQEQEEKERRLQAKIDEFNVNILKLDTKINVYVEKCKEAKRKGLKEQEANLRRELRHNLAQKKNFEAMLLNLETAMLNRDVAHLTQGFVQVLGDISDDICDVIGKDSMAEADKVKQKYSKALEASAMQTMAAEELLDMGDMASESTVQDGRYSSAVDEEIDNLLGDSALDLDVERPDEKFYNKEGR